MDTPVVAVLNMKGGVGKTTISANVFREFYRVYRKNTLLVDFDPQNNLSQLLLRRNQYEEIRESGKTLWNVINPVDPRSIFETSENDLMTPDSVSEYVHRLRSSGEVRLDLLPGDFQTAKINLMTEPEALRVRRQRFLNLIKEARTVYDLIVLDCNPSSSFMTRTAIEAATHLLIPVRADRYSILGLEMLMEFVMDLPTIERPPESIILINGLPNTGGQTSVIRELRSNNEHGPRTLVATIHETTLLEAKAVYTGFAVERGGPYSDILKRRLLAVARELAPKLRLTV